MKHLPLLALAALVVTYSAQAHAVTPPDSLVNDINNVGSNVGSNGPIAHPQLGGGPGDPIGCIGSPENATVVLALLSVGGLMAGRRITRLRPARVATAQTL